MSIEPPSTVFSPSRLDPALREETSSHEVASTDPLSLAPPTEDVFRILPPTPTNGQSMALSHLNNEASTADGLLQSFWSQNDRGSRSSSPHEAALSDVGSTTSLNDALREASVNSHSSASFDLASSGDKSAPLPAQDTEFVVPNKPASFKVGPGPRLTSTGKVSHARKVPVNHIKRPRNAFILFRSHACANQLVPTELGITDHRHISRIVGNLWKSLPVDEKRIWEEMAEKEKEEHRAQNPDYKYRPVYRRDGVVRRRRKKETADEEVEEEERKAEVVARVLLEGGEIDDNNLEKELELQRQKDAVEGRKRGSKSRSPSRRQRSVSYAEEEEEGFNPYPTLGRRNRRSRNTQVNYDETFDIFPGETEPNMFYGQEMQRFEEPQGNYYYGQETSLPQYDFPERRAPLPFDQQNISLDYLPATPRTFAMQQHQQSLQTRMTEHSAQDYQDRPISPMKDAFGNLLNRRYDEPASAYGPPTAAFDQHSSILPPSRFDAHYGRSANFFEQPVQQPHFGSDLNRLLNDSSASAVPYSAFGEMAAGSSQQQYTDIALRPDGEVQYVYLSREQAMDARLVEEIRSQGFGITYDMNADELPGAGMVQMQA